MRTIGKKNLALVVELTKKEFNIDPNSETIVERVKEKIPAKIFEIYESEHYQITRIICDVLNHLVFGLPPATMEKKRTQNEIETRSRIDALSTRITRNGKVIFNGMDYREDN